MREDLKAVVGLVEKLPDAYQRRAVRSLMEIVDEWEDRASLPEMTDREYRALSIERWRKVNELWKERFEEMRDRLRRKYDRH
jgi:hypothetical protein